MKYFRFAANSKTLHNFVIFNYEELMKRHRAFAFFGQNTVSLNGFLNLNKHFYILCHVLKNPQLRRLLD